MGIFDSIQAAIAAAAPNAVAGAQPQSAPATAQDANIAMNAASAALGLPIANVNVEEVLTNLAQQKGRPSNWKTSIVDLMTLLDLDSSLHNREQLADELGYSGQKGGSAEMNIFLHRKVMEQLQANGGVVPDSLKH